MLNEEPARDIAGLVTVEEEYLCNEILMLKGMNRAT